MKNKKVEVNGKVFEKEEYAILHIQHLIDTHQEVYIKYLASEKNLVVNDEYVRHD